MPANGLEALMLKRVGGGQRLVRIDSGHALHLRCAHEATCLRTFPSRPGWFVQDNPGATLRVWMQYPSGERTELARVGAGAGNSAAGGGDESFRQRLTKWWHGVPTAPIEHEVRLTWPAPVLGEFDLFLEACGRDVAIAVGPFLDAKARLLPLLRGRGIEVGPGMNPSVHSDATREVTYVEKMPMEQWASTYAKQPLSSMPAEHWARYIVDSAHRLDGFADQSVDFIFSSHVFEHLVNPLDTLRNWWEKLAPGGMIAGVVPDARFTFDLRQPLSTIEDLRAQRLSGRHDVTQAMYERWCRYTSPENSPASLRARDYAIHVNYFSPEVFRQMVDEFALNVAQPAGLFFESVVNGRDFGYLIVKP